MPKPVWDRTGMIGKEMEGNGRFGKVWEQTGAFRQKLIFYQANVIRPKPIIKNKIIVTMPIIINNGKSHCGVSLFSDIIL